MITKNIDISDRLINVQLCTIKYIVVSQNEVKTIDLTMHEDQQVNSNQKRRNTNLHK